MKETKVKKLKEGEELIFSDGKTLMEKVTVEEIDKKAGFAILSNRVKVARTKNQDGYYPRIDGKLSNITDITEESEKIYLAYKALYNIKRSMDKLEESIKNLNIEKDSDLILELDKKITKITNKL